MSEAPHTPVPPVPPAVATLKTELQALLDESRSLRGDVKGAEDARKRATALNLGLLGLLVLFVCMLTVVTWQNNELVHKVNDTNKLMADCTTPGGKCYEEGRARTGEVLADLVRSDIFMAQCARLYPNEAGPAYDRKLEACVYGRLAEAAKERQQAKTAPSASPAPTRGG